MGTACEYGKVAFRNNDQLHNVILKKLLPGSIKLINENNELKGVDQYVDDMLKQTMDHLVL
ncbi:hypothetical protein TELCIR_18145 [Teladorsagia circumcincta]|uniref:Uncharacterized protein n=1 Tax=Teladorsagia circumcincta TaxID=45464 RepID=A0A2G9TSW6_TELCI|nr:hypothetical protein TELCIR_18145 [Teladorsagia circumcincta]